jgi:Na+-transporting methylmalonyl-CoA/oxaloacetate decarboxylase gamma subunit
MFENFISAVEITIIGMSLVFMTIIFLWGVMVLLIRITPRDKSQVDLIPGTKDKPSSADESTIISQKMRAAAAAVVCALARNKQAPREFPLPPTAIVSAWQAVARSNVLKRGRVR